jgi:hypothetical protein
MSFLGVMAKSRPISGFAAGGKRGLGAMLLLGALFVYGNAVARVLSPFQGWSFFWFLPTACAVGCILAPLRGWEMGWFPLLAQRAREKWGSLDPTETFVRV